MWTWLATTMFVAVFIIRGKWNMNAAKDLLGEKFAGILITDRFASYNWIKSTVRQFCWAHLQRDMQKISERSGKPGRIGDEVLEYSRRMFRLWHRHKDGEISRKAFRAVMINEASEILETLELSKSPWKSRLALSEVMSILVLFHHFNGFRHFKAFYAYVCKHMKNAFPDLVSYNRFVELTKDTCLPLFFIFKRVLGQ